MTRGARAQIVVGIAVFSTLVAFRVFTRAQQPATFWDSSAYLETAARSMSWDQLFYPKPFFVPAVYRWLGADARAIVQFQSWFCLVSWTVLGASLVGSLKRPLARTAALVLISLLLLDPFRIGYCAAILSESINDSLMAFVVAAAVLLARHATHPKRAVALVGALVLSICAWILTRDTNAIVALVAVAACAVWWRRMLLRRLLLVLPLAAVTGVGLFSLWSTTVVPPPTGLTFHSGWPADFTARMTYSNLDNIFDRVLPDEDARAYFVSYGLPDVDKLVAIQHKEVANNATLRLAVFQPELASARRWIASSSRGVWLRWLLVHPLDRISDQFTNFWILMGAERDEQSWYMPRRWRGTGTLATVRALSSNHVALVVLVVLGALALFASRRDVLGCMAACIVVSGWVGSATALYGDSAELGRHCYGSGQQIVLGLVLALLAALERPEGLRALMPWRV